MQNNYKDMISNARAEGLVISEEYKKLANEKYKNLSHLLPNLWKAVMSHRYILPKHLQQDYINQELCDDLFLDFLLTYSVGYFPPEDNVTHVSYINAVLALEYNRPTYYIERGLAEALMRTDVPLDLQTEDIHWIFPQFRIYLPNDLLGITRRGKLNPAMFIDVCKVEENRIYEMPLPLQNELQQGKAWYFPKHDVSAEAFVLGTMLHFDCEESNVSYAITTPWHGSTLREMIDIGNSRDIEGALVSDELDHEFNSRILCFAVNVMLRLSSLPVEAQQNLKAEAKPIRKPRQEGKRSIAGLYPAKIIGMDEVTRLAAKLELPSEPTGKHLAAHWRRGHWRKQAYGPKSGLRRFQWIAPYYAGSL